MVWHNGWALLLEVGEYVFKLVLSSSFFLKEPLVSILTCLKKLWLIFHISYFEKKIKFKNLQIIFKSSSNQKLWRYQVLQQVKTIICEGNKFYKKLKPIVYFKCSIYLWFFKKFNDVTLNFLNYFQKFISKFWFRSLF
jgi:hypothetical protein